MNHILSMECVSLNKSTSYLPKKKELKVMIMKMFKELRRRMDEPREKLNKELKNIKKNQR